MLDALEDEFRIIIGLQVTKAILFFASGIWALQANRLTDLHIGYVIIWGSIEIASCIFAINSSKISRYLFYLIIYLPYYGIIFGYIAASIGMLIFAIFHSTNAFSFAILAAIPLYALIASVLSPIILILTLVQTVLLYRYHVPRWELDEKKRITGSAS